MSTKTEAAKELKLLNQVARNCLSRCHFETVDRELEKVDLPYELAQTWYDDLGRPSRKNLYYWRSKSWERGALYINETEAGRKMVTGTRNALEALRRVLLEAAGEVAKRGVA